MCDWLICLSRYLTASIWPSFPGGVCMKPSDKLVGGAVLGVLTLIGIEMNISAAPTAPVATVQGSAPVTVVNTTPVPVTGTITGQITGQVSINNQPTVNAVQSGPWNVTVGGPSLDTVNSHLTNIQNSVGHLQFDQAGSLYTALRSPVQTAGAAVSKTFQMEFRLDPGGLSDDTPIILGGAPTTINMTTLVLRTGHDNETVFVRGPFLTGGNVGADFVPVLVNSQATVATFPTPIPLTSFFVLCNNLTEHCDFNVTLFGY